MPHNDILRPQRLRVRPFASVATNSSTQIVLNGPMAFAGEVVRAMFVNGTTTQATSGTTTGSSASIVLYKNASNAGSVIATFNGSGTTVATLGTASLLTSGTAGSTNGRLAAGDILVGEFIGGVGNDSDNSGCFISVDVIYGRFDGATPAAGTGPA